MFETIKKAFDWIVKDRSDFAMVVRTFFETAASFITVHLPEILGLFQIREDVKILLVGFFTIVYTAIIGKVREIRESKEANK